MENKKKYPFGFYVCSFTFTLERMAFYSSKWLIAIWIVAATAKGGLGLEPAQGAMMSANFVAFTYITPMIGGYIADHWISPRICVTVGAILMGAGYVCGYFATGSAMVWMMIILVSIGTGLFKGNLSGVNGQQFHEKEILDSAFTIQYSFVNIGSLIGTTFVAFVARAVSYNFCFLVCGILLFLDAAWFGILGKKHLGECGKYPFKQGQVKERTAAVSRTPLTHSQRDKVFAIVMVTIFSIVFWLVWYLTYMPVYYYWGPDSGCLNHANWMIGSFTVPSSWFDSVNGLACILLGPVLAAFWSKKAQTPKGDLSMFKKTGLGMVFMGLAFMVMCFADIIRGENQASLLWILAVGLLMSLGEMVFSPLGNSFITKFAPKELLGLLLGFWAFAIFIPAKSYGYLFAILEKQNFVAGYGTVGLIVLACGVVLWFADKKLNKLLTAED